MTEQSMKAAREWLLNEFGGPIYADVAAPHLGKLLDAYAAKCVKEAVPEGSVVVEEAATMELVDSLWYCRACGRYVSPPNTRCVEPGCWLAAGMKEGE